MPTMWKWYTKKTFKTTHSDPLVMLLSFYQRVWKLGILMHFYAFLCIIGPWRGSTLLLSFQRLLVIKVDKKKLIKKLIKS